MTTSTYVSQLDAISKKVESFIQSLQNAEIHPSKEQYTTFKALSLRLCEASADIPVEIEAISGTVGQKGPCPPEESQCIREKFKIIAREMRAHL